MRLCFWFDVLFHVNLVSKKLQGGNVSLDDGLKSFSNLLKWTKEYRKEGFEDIISTTNELADELNIPEENRMFITKQTCRKKLFF